MTMDRVPDRIEKTVVLKVPRSRAWRAIASADEFGAWFRVKFDQPFAAGMTITGAIQEPGYEGTPMTVTVEDIEPETLFSFRWHPGAVEPGYDYSAEPTTLVEFRLEDAPGGTLLTVTESGFHGIPLERRAGAWRGNDEGWTIQAGRIAEYVAR